MSSYEIQIGWSMAGGLVYVPPDPPSLWLPEERDATAIPYAILICLLSWGRSRAASPPTTPHGWWGEAHLPPDALPWGNKIWEHFNDTVSPELAGELAADCAESLKPLQALGLLGDVDVSFTPEGDSVSGVVAFTRPAGGGGRFKPLWDAYEESIRA